MIKRNPHNPLLHTKSILILSPSKESMFPAPLHKHSVPAKCTVRFQAALEPTVRPSASHGNSRTNCDPSREKKLHQMQRELPPNQTKSSLTLLLQLLLKVAYFTCFILKPTPKPVHLELCDVPHVQSSHGSKPPGAAKGRDKRNQSKPQVGSAQPGSRAPLVSTMNSAKEKFNPVMQPFNQEQINKRHMQHSTNLIVGKKAKFFLIYKPL